MLLQKYIRLWALAGVCCVMGVSSMSAGKVTVSIKQGNQWVPYDENTRDDGIGDYDNNKLWMQFPDYGAIFNESSQYQAGNIMQGILEKINKKEILPQIARARQTVKSNYPLQNVSVVYRMLYLGSGDTRTQPTRTLNFKLSVTESSNSSETWVFYDSSVTQGQHKITGNGEQDFNILINNISTEKPFIVSHRENEQFFMQVYVVLGQIKYIFMRGKQGNLSNQISSVVPANYRQALDGRIIPISSPVAQQPTSQPPVSLPNLPPSQPVNQPRPVVTQPAPVPEHPLVKNCTMLSLYGKLGNGWNSLGKAEIKMQETFGKNPSFKDFNNTTMSLHVAGISLERFREELARERVFWNELPGMRNRFFTGKNVLDILPDPSSLGGWDCSVLANRLGLPLSRITLQFFILKYDDNSIQGLSLPLSAPIGQQIPVAVILATPDGWNRYYDQKAGLLCRNFPAISGIGVPLLRNVVPENSLNNLQEAKDACEWYALTPDLLDRLKDGSPQSVCFFLIHPQGVEMHFVVLQRKLEGDETFGMEFSGEENSPQQPLPSSCLNLAGTRLLELRYLAKVYPDIQKNDHYRAFLTILNHAYFDKIYYTYEPNYHKFGNPNFRFWRVQGEIPYIIPYDESNPVYDIVHNSVDNTYTEEIVGWNCKDHFTCQYVDMAEKSDLFNWQWFSAEGEDLAEWGTYKEGEAYAKLRELKVAAMNHLLEKRQNRNLTEEQQIEIDTQLEMLDIDWWVWNDALCNQGQAQNQDRGITPLLGEAFRETWSEVVSPDRVTQ
ncbi:MAG: hypothetical protein LBG98_02430 [Puniceicoccales bacterium]|jgi:hypothetical protein|nr:hypothetical protein [Puniceicoccales bacterium]